MSVVVVAESHRLTISENSAGLGERSIKDKCLRERIVHLKFSAVCVGVGVCE
jgi:hypothetical protein